MKTCMCVSTQSDKWELFEEYPVVGEPNEYTILVQLPDGDVWWLHKSDEYPGYHFARTSTGKLVFVLVED